MAYQRKTKDVYGLIWNNEEIDCFNTLKEAREMQKEYELAYHGTVTIKVRRERIGK